MYKHLKITVYFPCRNEGDHLEKVIKRVPDFVDEIIVVSNNSTDDTYEKAIKLGVKAFKDDRTVNGIGYGFAHMTGIENATGDIIASADGDATYPIEDLSKIIDHLLENKLDFISCNRYPLQNGVKIPLKLQLGVNILNIETRLLYGIKMKDVLSGMWVFKKEVKENLNLNMGEWNMSPQIKINVATNKNIKFGEYSISQYQRLGETKQRYFKTGFDHMIWIFLNKFNIKYNNKEDEKI